MLDIAGRKLNVPQHKVASGLDALDAALADLGFVPPPRYGTSRNVVCGTASRVSVRHMLDNEEVRKNFLRKLCRLVAEGIPVNLSLLDFCSQGSGIALLQRFCEVIRESLSWRGLSGRHIGLCMHAHQMPLEAYRLIADVVLRPGRRYVFLDSLQMATHGNREVAQRADANWSFLWRQRAADRAVMPVYGGIVRSACPLLADEVAATVLPGGGVHGPVNSAWLPVTLPITAFATRDGRIQWQSLLTGIRQAVTIAEQMLDQLSWPDPGQRADARQNRRLAFQLTGIGDLVASRGDDPTHLECLNWLSAVVARIRSELYAQSARIATEFGAAPALQEANHVSQWNAGPQRESWSRHWEDALRLSGVRHRNLLLISPYSVIPTGASSLPVFSDLLPVIGLADAWSFTAPADFRDWNVAQFRDFHRRARAIIQRPRTASVIAAGA